MTPAADIPQAKRPATGGEDAERQSTARVTDQGGGPATPTEEQLTATQQFLARIAAGQETLAGMKRRRKQELKAAREKNPRPDLDQFETRAVFQKRAKKGKDRLGLRRVSRKKCRVKKPKRSGCFVIGGPK
uniref:Uncharacterized protein n=1 Tax=Peronospora matthiolae TaxID=2874970 RepID=A0AAV1UGI7_9STRA